VTRARFIPVERLPGTERGDGGFGSTGYRIAASHAPESGVSA
jgi:dUTP pyrophosphatase